MYKVLTVDEWADIFQPILNPNSDWEGSYSAFETYGEDLEFVKQHMPEFIWTEMDGDNGVYIVNGYHYVNRIQYYVCKTPMSIDKDVEVVVTLFKDCDCADEGEGNPDCEFCLGDGTLSIYPDTREELVEIYGEEYANQTI
jgi:hypothetical protein